MVLAPGKRHLFTEQKQHTLNYSSGVAVAKWYMWSFMSPPNYPHITPQLTNTWFLTLGLAEGWMAHITPPRSQFVQCITTVLHLSFWTNLFKLENNGKGTDFMGMLYVNSRCKSVFVWPWICVSAQKQCAVMCCIHLRKHQVPLWVPLWVPFFILFCCILSCASKEQN